MKLKDCFFITMQHLLPQHALSRLGGKFANCEIIWLKNLLIRKALSHYKINMQSAKNIDALSYKSFNDFFTRELARPAAEYFPKLPKLGSPAEGVVSQLGRITSGEILQAKGRSYTVESLLAEHNWAETFKNGQFATIYLAPHNYHRVHCPIAGDLTEVAYVPGKLFSVNLVTADHIENLFARNERLIFYIETQFGKVALVMVGALMVAGMKSSFMSWPRKEMNKLQKHTFSNSIPLNIGDELGYFDFGSTVVLCFENPDLKWGIATGSALNLGEPMAQLHSAPN